MEELESDLMPINPTIMRVMRVLRIARGKELYLQQYFPRKICLSFRPSLSHEIKIHLDEQPLPCSVPAAPSITYHY